jgi:hypothetical protein
MPEILRRRGSAMSAAGVLVVAAQRGVSDVKEVLPGWRPLSIVFLALTLLSTVSLYVLADRTDELFAWTINPALSAAFLGGGYAAGFVLIVLTIRERVWARARIAYATVCVFVWVTLVATLLHLDRFHFDADWWPRSLAWLWLVVYVVVPPWMTLLLLAQRRASGADPPIAKPIGRGLATALAAQAVVLTIVGVGLVVSPTRVDQLWPWALTPLVARVIGAWCVALGFAAGLALWERDLSRLHAAAITYVVFGLLQAGAIARYHGDVEWDGPSIIVYLAMLAVITTCGAYGWLQARRHRSTAPPPARPANPPIGLEQTP